ncbi:MAG TPA: hypothetical protein VGE18_02340 [Candidatus Paceibacterota bacterium]
MKKILIAFVLIISLFSTNTAYACKPDGNWPPTAKENLAQKDIAFIGTVQMIAQDKSVNGDYRITFKVDQVYKGTLGNTVTIQTTSSSAACGYDNGYETFQAGSVWMIYANGTAVNGYTTNSLALNTSYASIGLAVTAMTGYGITVPGEETPTMCTMQYMPVCGKSPSGVTKTYGNSCMLGADKATTLYEGECKSATPAPAAPEPAAPSNGPTAAVSAEGSVAGGLPMMPGMQEVQAPVSFWQKILLSIKSALSFLN